VNATTVERVTSAGWRDAVARAHGEHARFGGAWAADGAWRALFLTGDARRVLSCEPDSSRVDTIVDIVEAAGWDEREAHDLRGLDFTGHQPLRPLADHGGGSAAWTPVTGDGVHQVAVGPVHAGVIESGHFRFHVVGERILALDPQLFYKHRGLERAAEGLDVDAALAYAGRACAACAVSNTVAYAQAAEDALGLRPDRAVRVARTVLLELERLYNHLHDIGAICAGVGFAPGAMAFAALKDRAQRLNARLAGHRFLFGSVAVGQSRLSLGADASAELHSDLRDLRVDAAAAWRDLEFAGSLLARLDGVGVLGHDDALRLGAVGPAARASGVRHDVRSVSPGLWYGDFAPATVSADGDVAARLRQRAAELESTCDILEHLSREELQPGACAPSRAPVELGAGVVESPRGATTCAVELDGRRVTRLRLRTASYANWPALAHATAGNLLPDFPLINKSFELCYACVDR
jgi:Ni,Fe-hydrogenase III large subunit